MPKPKEDNRDEEDKAPKIIPWKDDDGNTHDLVPVIKFAWIFIKRYWNIIVAFLAGTGLIATLRGLFHD